MAHDTAVRFFCYFLGPRPPLLVWPPALVSIFVIILAVTALSGNFSIAENQLNMTGQIIDIRIIMRQLVLWAFKLVALINFFLQTVMSLHCLWQCLRQLNCWANSQSGFWVVSIWGKGMVYYPFAFQAEWVLSLPPSVRLSVHPPSESGW